MALGILLGVAEAVTLCILPEAIGVSSVSLLPIAKQEGKPRLRVLPLACQQQPSTPPEPNVHMLNSAVASLAPYLGVVVDKSG